MRLFRCWKRVFNRQPRRTNHWSEGGFTHFHRVRLAFRFIVSRLAQFRRWASSDYWRSMFGWRTWINSKIKTKQRLCFYRRSNQNVCRAVCLALARFVSCSDFTNERGMIIWFERIGKACSLTRKLRRSDFTNERTVIICFLSVSWVCSLARFNWSSMPNKSLERRRVNVLSSCETCFYLRSVPPRSIQSLAASW